MRLVPRTTAAGEEPGAKGKALEGVKEEQVKAEAEELGADGMETEVRGRSGSLKAMGGADALGSTAVQEVADVGKRIEGRAQDGCKTAMKGDMAVSSLQRHDVGASTGRRGGSTHHLSRG